MFYFQINEFYDDFGGGGSRPLYGLYVKDRADATKLFNAAKAAIKEKWADALSGSYGYWEEESETRYILCENSSMVYWGTEVCFFEPNTVPSDVTTETIQEVIDAVMETDATDDDEMFGGW